MPIESESTSFGGSAAVEFEKRADVLETRGRQVTVKDLDGCQVLQCRADRIEEEGLELTVPVGSGFAVGHRYEICVLPEGGSGGEERYATVVQTQQQGGSEQEGLAVGLRFDQPLIL